MKNLTPRQRALVSLAVLLDGIEGATYLENDSVSGPLLKRAAQELVKQPPELRLPLVGTLLRMALEETS